MPAPAVLDAPPAPAPPPDAAAEGVGEAAASAGWRPRPVPAGQTFRLSGVTWEQYVAINDAIPPGGARLSYHDGELQFMSAGPLHEELKNLVALLVYALAHCRGVDLKPMGNVTLRSAAAARGFEPDDCYYVGVRRGALNGLAPHEMPPPELALEVEVTATVLDRLPMYAAVGVTEVWRCDGERGLTFLRLDGGAYRPVPESGVFVGVTPQMVWDAVTELPEDEPLRYQLAAVDFFRGRLAGD